MIRAVPFCLIATIALAAPALKDKRALYFPTHVGDRRVYERKTGDDIAEDSNVVTRVEARTAA